MQGRAARSAIIVLLVATIDIHAHAQTVEVARASIAELVGKLERSEVDRVDVFAIPPNVFVRTAITPQAMEKQFDYRFTIRMLRGGAYENDVKKVVSSLSVKQLAQSPDLRWGVVFYDLDGKRVAAIYFDRSGSSGVVGDTPVSCGGELFSWLNREFARLVR